MNEVSELIESTKKFLKASNIDFEFHALQAEYMKQFYDALIKKGFNSDQAIQLIAGAKK